MESGTDVGAVANPGYDGVRVKRRLRPVVIRRVASTTVAGGQNTAPIETSAEGSAALISVWWDQLPGENP